ncbi:MAG: alkyl sulfatase dimerization domain-containing protein [Acidimicrobiia bacterium]
MNAGTDVFTLMKEIVLPPELRVGQGYGKVAWAVRTIWETYMGWFHLQSSTELYPVQSREATSELVQLVGVEAACDRSAVLATSGEPVLAIHIAEAILSIAPAHEGAAKVMVTAHEVLLATGGDVSFWESGWLRSQADKWRS